MIARHDFECTDATLNAYRPDMLNENMQWKS